MNFYRDSFGNLHVLPAQGDALGLMAPLQIDWGEVIIKSLLVGGTLYLAAKGIEAVFHQPQRRRPVPRDTFRYILKDGRNGVQFGITNNPPVRCSQHLSAGKTFSMMEIIGPAVSRASARQWEHTRIESYRRRSGQRPKYNKVS